MSDLIRRSDAVNELAKFLGVPARACIHEAENLLKVVPSAQPEIIRCKDCKHYDGRPCGIVDWYNTADDFCSRAERRTDG